MADNLYPDNDSAQAEYLRRKGQSSKEEGKSNILRGGGKQRKESKEGNSFDIDSKQNLFTNGGKGLILGGGQLARNAAGPLLRAASGLFLRRAPWTAYPRLA